LIKAVVRLVALCSAHAQLVVLSNVILAVLLGAYAAARLGMNADTFSLIDPHLPWRQREIALNQAFPRDTNQLVIVIDGAEPAAADAAAERLATMLATDMRHFKTVTRPDGGEFFRRNGLLFLSLERAHGRFRPDRCRATAHRLACRRSHPAAFRHGPG
jgi:hypothetical protein